jgi:hypothetical protein
MFDALAAWTASARAEKDHGGRPVPTCARVPDAKWCRRERQCSRTPVAAKAATKIVGGLER